VKPGVLQCASCNTEDGEVSAGRGAVGVPQGSVRLIEIGCRFSKLQLAQILIPTSCEFEQVVELGSQVRYPRRGPTGEFVE